MFMNLLKFSKSGLNSDEMFGPKFCFLKASDEPDKMFNFLQGATAREYFRFPEEPKAILGDIRGVMENADRFEMDPIFKNVRAQVKHTLELSSADQKRHFRERMIADEKKRLNFFQLFRGGGRKQRFEDADTMAQYHVDLPGFMTAQGIMGYFHQTDGISAEEIESRKKMLNKLKEALGKDIVDNPQNHPVFLWAVSALLQSGNPSDFLKKVIPPKIKGFLDADLQKKAFDEVQKNAESMDHMVHEIEENGGHNFLKKLAAAKCNLLQAKSQYDEITKIDPTAIGTPTDKKYAKAGYEKQVDALEKTYKKAEEQYEKLYSIFQKFLVAQETFFKKLSVLTYPDRTPDPNDPKKLKEPYGQYAHAQFRPFEEFQRKYLLHGPKEKDSSGTPGTENYVYKGELNFNFKAKYHDAYGVEYEDEKTVEEKFKVFLDALNNNQFHAEFNPIKKHITNDIEKLKADEQKIQGKDSLTPIFTTEQEFLYKVIFHRRTNTVENGGVLPNGTTLSQYQIADMKPDIVHEALLNMMEARSLKLMTDANKLRMERYTKASLRSSWWTNLFGGKYPMKNLPPLDTALKRLRILEFDSLDEKGEVVKDDKGNAVKERPFAHLKLKGKMDLADLRKLVSEGYLKKQDIPRLIGHLESILAGYERYQIREKDLVPLLNLIKNLQILQVFHLHDQFKKNAEGDPDHLDLVITALWKNDLKISEKVAADSQKKLFQILRKDYKGESAYRKQEEALIAEAKEKFTDKETGKFDFAAAKEFLQDKGLALGLGGLGLYLAGKKLRLGTKLKNWLPKTKAEQEGKVTGAGLARRLGYGAVQAVKGTPRFLWSTTKFLPWTLPKAALKKIVKPAFDKLGVTKVASKVGNGIVSGGKIVGGKIKKEVTGLFSELKQAATQLPDKINIFRGGGGGHGGGHH